MNETLIQLVIFGIEELIKVAPGVAAQIQTLMAKPDATAADWADLRNRIQSKTYFDYVPSSSLPKP